MIEDIWWETLDVGRSIATQPDEASQRAGISRMYLGLYNLARLALIRQGIRPPPNVNTHVWVWDQLQSQSSVRRSALGSQGHVLRTWRNRADYEARMPDIDRRRVSAVLLVAEFSNELRVMLQTNDDSTPPGFVNAPESQP